MKKITLIALFLFNITLVHSQTDIYVRNISWHTGIIIPVDSLALEMIPELESFEESDYVEFGIGDEVYYQKEDPTYYDAARAAVIPNTAVVKVKGRFITPEKLAAYYDGYIYKISINNNKYKKLLKYISDCIKREDDMPVISSIQHQSNSIFYKCTQKFHILNTCNNWVAKALDSSGIMKVGGVVIRSPDLEELLVEAGFEKVE